MLYNGYQFSENKNEVIVRNLRDFNLKHIFECGQCFRWIKIDDNTYKGIASNKAVTIRQNNDMVTLENSNIEDFKSFWFDYFDLDRDYGQIKDILSKKDNNLKKAIEFGHGIRLLKQDLWELLISFIISANNRIPMIMKVVDKISTSYGKSNEYSKEFFSFPTSLELANVTESELRACSAGFRAKYIEKTTRLYNDSPITYDELKNLDINTARQILMNCPGVGPKVADCILLFSGVNYSAFPTDVWVKKVMGELYFEKEASLVEIQKFSKEYFGELAGFAQQYLFYYARSNLFV